MSSTRLILALLSGLLLLSGAAAAAETPSEPIQERLIAPDVIAQREFALHVANALGIKVPGNDDPARAARALAAQGIAPRAGWQPDEAVTPLTIAEIRDAIAYAASAGRLRVDPVDAVRAYEQIVAQLELPLPVEPPRYAEEGKGVKRYEGGCDASAYDYYYGGTGVPPYTYCPPPPAYVSMYLWVGTPFYWSGYYFPGYYALRYPYVIVFPHEPVRPPRFSEGVLGGAPRPAPPPPATPGGGRGFRDTPIVQGRPPVQPRAIPLPDRDPRFSEGMLGGQRSLPRTAPSIPPAGSTRIPPAPRPAVPSVPRSSAPPPGARPSSPSPAPAPAPSPGGGPGWRDVIGR
jgi:hypothetical protein